MVQYIKGGGSPVKKSGDAVLEEIKLLGKVSKSSPDEGVVEKDIELPLSLIEKSEDDSVTVGCKLSRTVNLGNYESLKVEFFLSKKCADDDHAYDVLANEVYDKVHVALHAMVKDQRKKLNLSDDHIKSVVGGA